MEFSDLALADVWQGLIKDFCERLKKEPPSTLLEDLSKRVGATEEAAVERLIRMAVFDRDMQAFLTNVTLGQEGDLCRSVDKTPYASGAVTLMTLHGAKGLEFPTVFLYGVNQGTLPLEAPNRPADVEEERRLFYVGITRAKDRLILTSSGTPSSFIADIPSNALCVEPAGAPQTGKQFSLFD